MTRFPEGTPVIFITSEIDNSVPCEGTIRLANELASQKKNDVYLQLLVVGLLDIYLLVLKNSSHPKYMIDDAQDTEDYLALIHAAYKAYGLPHIPWHADNGKELLSQCKL